MKPKTTRRTVRVGAKVWHDISNSDIDDTEEALVLLLELLLIKDLDCQDATFICTTKGIVSYYGREMMIITEWGGL